MERFFLNPLALAWGALAGGIILLYILKLKRVKVDVSSTLLWEQALADFRANAPWQKLRRNLLMILQIIALILLALALSRPFMFDNFIERGKTIFVIDASASMLAKDGSPDRLADAIRLADDAVTGFPRGAEGMVIVAGPQSPITLSSFTSNKNTLKKAIARSRDYAGGQADLDSAMRFCSSISEGEGQTQVVIFSDGAVDDLSPESTTDLKIHFFPVGQTADNVAIVGAGARLNPANDNYELFVAVHNFYGTQQDFELTLFRNDVDSVTEEVSLRPGQRREIVIDQVPYFPDPLKVEIKVDDPLAEDNTAWIVLPEKPRYKVALCTQSDSILLRALLQSLPNIDYYEYDGSSFTQIITDDSGEASDDSQPTSTDMDVWVVEGDAPCINDPSDSYLFINSTSNPLLPVNAGEEVEKDYQADPPIYLAVVGESVSHPITRIARFNTLNLNSQRRVQLKSFARSIVDTSEGALIVEGDNNGQRSVYMAFDIYDSNFPVLSAFPLFMMDTISYLGQSSAGAAGNSISAGQPAELLAPVEAMSYRLKRPDGSVENEELNSRRFAVSDTRKIGIYEVDYLDEGGGLVLANLLPVSLVNEFESNIAPSTTLRTENAEEYLASNGTEGLGEIKGVQEVMRNREFYPWIIGLVLLLVTIEWYLYHTRIF
ncbi:VWA domain-containing protein [bacterium]|nr:VWA domain-containing protein [bacterium]